MRVEGPASVMLLALLACGGSTAPSTATYDLTLQWNALNVVSPCDSSCPHSCVSGSSCVTTTAIQQVETGVLTLGDGGTSGSTMTFNNAVATVSGTQFTSSQPGCCTSDGATITLNLTNVGLTSGLQLLGNVFGNGFSGGAAKGDPASRYVAGEFGAQRR